MGKLIVRTEKDLWVKVLRPLLNVPTEKRLAYKVQDAFVKGLPDVVAMLGGTVWWLELKITPAPVRAGTPWRIPVTPEQRRFLLSWWGAGGNAGILTFDPRSSVLYLFSPNVATESAERPPALATIPLTAVASLVDALGDYSNFLTSHINRD